MNNLNCKNFGELSDEQIKAVLQLTYQLIASANYGNISESDDSSIDVMMKALGFTGPILSNLGNAYWNDAMDMNAYHAFDVVSRFNSIQKQTFKDAVLSVANKANTLLRMDIARQIFNRVGI